MGFLKSIGKGLQKGLDVLTGKKAAKRAEESQDRAREENFRYGEMAADAAHQRSLGLLEAQTEASSYVSQVQDAKDAGLSVGLLYGGGGAGGAGKAGGGAQGAQGGPEGINYLDVEAIKNERASLAIEKARQATEKMLAKKEAEKIEAETENIKEETETGKTLTPFQQKLLNQQGIAIWLENIRKDWENRGPDTEGGVVGSKDYDFDTAISEGGAFSRKIAAEIANTLASANSNEASAEAKKAAAALDTEKKKGYWQELLNATRREDTEAEKAAAIKLAAQWQTGELTNWKTWTDVSVNALSSLSEVLKLVVTKGASAATK